MIVQYAGDYLEAYERQRATGTESYFGHGYVLSQLAAFRAALGEVAVLCCLSGRDYVETLPDGVVVMGMNANPHWHARAISRRIAEYDPTHLIVHGPMTQLIRAGITDGRRVACIFADSFCIGALRRWVKYGRLAHVLNRPEVEWVANHGANACRSLVDLGVAPGKILPWDWPHPHDPKENPPKIGPQDGVPTLVYVGSIHRSKGVGDAIDAVAELKARSRAVRLRIAGAGNVGEFAALARRRKVEDRVEFLGLIPNDRVVTVMREASVVLVPSRHRFPEGLPLTIYEALRSRTPIVASDHPMFGGHLVDGQTALVHPAGDARQLADCVVRLLDDPALYSRLSAAAPGVWQGMQIPAKWGHLIVRWVSGGDVNARWFADHLIANYDPFQ